MTTENDDNQPRRADDTIIMKSLRNNNLLTANVLLDRPVDLDQIFKNRLPEKFLEPQSAGTAALNVPVWKIALFSLEENDLSMGLSVSRPCVLGRGTTDNSEPYFDLSPFAAFQKGISRRHVLIKPDQTELQLYDLASTNGTWFNDQLVRAGEPVVLHDGAKLKIGSLILGLRIVESPESA